MESKPHSDIDLERLRQGDPAALESLVRAHAGLLLRGAMSMGFGTGDAEELVQSTFAAFLSSVRRFEGRSQLKTYLYGIMRNKGLELMRERRREIAGEEVEAAFDARFDAAGHWLAGAPKGPEEAALTKELAELIKACADGLAEAQRTAFFLKEAEGADNEEICNVLGVTDTNLRVMLHRARLKLRECLERSWAKG